jgi:excisionase family DNA binding protein
LNKEVQNPFAEIDSRLQRIEAMLQQQQTIVKEEPIRKELKTRKEAAAFLGITLPTLHKMTHDGRIQGRRIGSRIRFYQSDLEKALKAIKSK